MYVKNQYISYHSLGRYQVVFQRMVGIIRYIHRLGHVTQFKNLSYVNRGQGCNLYSTLVIDLSILSARVTC